jgi:ribosomal protein S27AE
MTSSIVTDTRWCPNCSAPMRLTRVLPTVLPKDCAPETRVFGCTTCGTTVTLTMHEPQALQRFRIDLLNLANMRL